jgi:methylenetetrahydrofolate dehydrogenase (NADP+)/methenyltetrahydrofolate cyclohydrolase
LSKLLEGKPIAAKIQQEIKAKIAGFMSVPVLVSIMLGENAGAEAYVRSQKKVADELGIDYRLHKLPQHTTERELINFIEDYNMHPEVNGIIIQMPLPEHIDYKKISQFIKPEKDVEGLHPANIGKIMFGKAVVVPCTAAAVMELLYESGIDLYGKEVVVVGHSEIVGKPLSLLLLEKFSTVTVCHIGTSKAGRLAEHTSKAEVLIVAVGKPNLIKGQDIKEHAVVIDVGINRVEGKIVGDVEFEEAAKKASFITPVPGGVGPLTVTMLMRNLVNAKISQDNAVL